MAENIDNLSDSFSIMDTMEMGMGNQQLLEGLFAPETASADPKDVTPIIATVTPAEPKEKPVVEAGKEITPVAADADDKTKSQAAISNFLGNNTEEEEEDDASPVAAAITAATSSEDTNSTYTALANDLFNLGVFTKNENEGDVSITTPEEFLERFQGEVKKGTMGMMDNFLSQFGEDYRNAFDAIYVKGVDPKDYFGTYNTIVNFAELDLSQEDNQVRVIRQALTDQGFDSEDIETEVERLKSYGDLETVSTKHHKVLVKKEAQKLHQMEADAEKELQQKALIKNQFVQNVQNVLADKLKAKEFDGIPLTPKLASELQDFLLVDKWKTPTGETLSDFDRFILDLKRPENHVMKVKMALLSKLLEKDPNLTTIQKNGVTKKTDSLFSEVARQVTKDKTVPSSQSNSKPNSWFL